MSVQNSIRGKNNRKNGERFESIIDTACLYYRKKGMALIMKTPEPLRPLRPVGNGKFEAVFVKKAQPDFKGTLLGGKSVLFDAKNTTAEKISHSVVSDAQGDDLEAHEAIGGDSFIIISFRFTDYYRVPWDVWRDMKRLFGRKYITPKDINEYQIVFRNGILDFLDLIKE